jgi:hypothetical protein
VNALAQAAADLKELGAIFTRAPAIHLSHSYGIDTRIYSPK